MARKKTTVMVDGADPQMIKETASREGPAESEYFRETFPLAALRTRRWSGDWDIPRIGFGGPVTDEDVDRATAEAVDRKHPATGGAA